MSKTTNATNATNPNQMPDEVQIAFQNTFMTYLPVAMDTFEKAIYQIFGSSDYKITLDCSKFNAKTGNIETTLLAHFGHELPESLGCVVRGVFSSPEGFENPDVFGSVSIWNMKDPTDLLGIFEAEESTTVTLNLSIPVG